MIKALIKLLIVGSSCSTIAVISTKFASIDGDIGESKIAEYKKNKITEIKSYGDIDLFARQNGCVFRIFDETNDTDYSLAEFSSIKGKEIPNLEKDVWKLANDGRHHCGKNGSRVMAIFYDKDARKFALKNGKALINNPKDA